MFESSKSIFKYIPIFALAFALPTQSFAAESVAGGLEFSGHVDVVSGWQQDDGNTLDFGSCSFGIGGLGCNSIDSAGSGYGILGNFRGLGAPNRSTFNFYLDEVELDIDKTFGEHIRIRADIDMGRFLSGTPNAGGANIIVEQAYVTTYIPIGNGAELLFGRFNIPMGYESVDRIHNSAISFTNIFRYVRPHNVTGAKFYYEFSDAVDWSLYVVNSLADTISFAVNTDSAIPSYGTQLRFHWGEEGNRGSLGISYAGGPENFGNNAHLTHIFDLDFIIPIGERLSIYGEGIYRQDNTGFVTPGGVSFVGFPNSKVWGGNLLFELNFGEHWLSWHRYGYIHDIDVTGAYTGLDQQIHTLTNGFGYRITDNATFKFEWRIDLRLYASTQLPGIVLPGSTTSWSHGLAGEFGYEF